MLTVAEGDDPSIVVRFRRCDGQGSLLAWTTTPWTLPSNVALAVHPDETYVDVDHQGETLTLARARLEATFPDGDVQVRRELQGSELVGVAYEPLYSYREPEGGRAYDVVAADFVTLDTCTGIVHIAPAFGEDDFRVARELGLGFLQLIEPVARLLDQRLQLPLARPCQLRVLAQQHLSDRDVFALGHIQGHDRLGGFGNDLDAIALERADQWRLIAAVGARTQRRCKRHSQDDTRLIHVRIRRVCQA